MDARVWRQAHVSQNLYLRNEKVAGTCPCPSLGPEPLSWPAGQQTPMTRLYDTPAQAACGQVGDKQDTAPAPSHAPRRGEGQKREEKATSRAGRAGTRDVGVGWSPRRRKRTHLCRGRDGREAERHTSPGEPLLPRNRVQAASACTSPPGGCTVTGKALRRQRDRATLWFKVGVFGWLSRSPC